MSTTSTLPARGCRPTETPYRHSSTHPHFRHKLWPLPLVLKIGCAHLEHNAECAAAEDNHLTHKKNISHHQNSYWINNLEKKYPEFEKTVFRKIVKFYTKHQLIPFKILACEFFAPEFSREYVYSYPSTKRGDLKGLRAVWGDLRAFDATGAWPRTRPLMLQWPPVQGMRVGVGGGTRPRPSPRKESMSHEPITKFKGTATPLEIMKLRIYERINYGLFIAISDSKNYFLPFSRSVSSNRAIVLSKRQSRMGRAELGNG